MIDVVVAGAAGRMGSRVIACLGEAGDLRLVGALEAPGHPRLGADAGEVAGTGRLGVTIGTDPAALLTRDRVSNEGWPCRSRKFARSRSTPRRLGRSAR